MGRYTKSESRGHKVQDLGHGCYRLSWVVDRYYPNSRLRHPTVTTRDTDREGMERFVKRWKLDRN